MAQVSCKRTDLPVDEVTVSVDEGTGKNVFIDKRIRHVRNGVLASGYMTGSLPTSHCLDQTSGVSKRVGVLAENVGRVS